MYPNYCISWDKMHFNDVIKSGKSSQFCTKSTTLVGTVMWYFVDEKRSPGNVSWCRCLGLLSSVFRALLDIAPVIKCRRVWLAVIAPKKHVCQTGKPIQITQSRGILASLVAAETGCGTAQAPWQLRALPGQRINITLLDFSWAATANDVFFLPASGGKSSSETGLTEVKNRFHFADETVMTFVSVILLQFLSFCRLYM